MQNAPHIDPLLEIDALQDELLRELDELNARLEQTLARYMPDPPQAPQRDAA